MQLRQRLLDMLTGVALVASIITATVVVRGQIMHQTAQASNEPKIVKDWQRFTATGRRLGSTRAPLQIVEFADFQCPACRALHQMLVKLDSENPGKFAVAYHYVPLSYHPMAYPAARAAECAAAQGKFAQYHDILFSQFDSLTPSSFSELARRVAIQDMPRFDACIASTDSVQRINADRALAFDTLGIKGTPTTIINGKMYSFAPSLADLTKMIKEAR